MKIKTACRTERHVFGDWLVGPCVCVFKNPKAPFYLRHTLQFRKAILAVFGKTEEKTSVVKR